MSSNASNLDRIKVVQCDIKTKKIYAIEHVEKLGKSYQFYDIDDVDFCNWYGQRDPFAYSDGLYTPNAGWCKIGIGLNETDAFASEHLCDIEIENIYVNSAVKAANDSSQITKKLNVCRLESNSDKTVRITFGDGTIVNNGFNTEDEILFVQYVTTNGYAANTADVTDSALSNGSKIMANAPGKMYDMTSNVSFVLTSDISGGENFESKLSMKNNAAVYFASRGQLINKKDFTAYFRSLSKPITVNNAIAWNITDIQANTDDTYTEISKNMKYLQNAVFYTVIGDLYESLGDDVYTVKKLYTDTDPTIVGTTTLYNDLDTFSDHIADLALLISNKSLQDAFIAQAISKSDPFYMNTFTINNELCDRLPFGVLPISLPPIVQYFDLVGYVEVDRSTNMSDYQAEAESTVYKWLKDNQSFNNKIYKSDIVKLLYGIDHTKSVNVDLTPSSLIWSKSDEYEFKGSNDLSETNDSDLAYITSTNGYTNNVIIVPKISNKTVVSKAFFEGLKSPVVYWTTSSETGTKTAVSIQYVTELSDGRLQLTLADGYYTNLDRTIANISYNIVFEVAAEDDAYCKTNEVKSDNNAAISKMCKINEQVGAVNTTVETAVKLPYLASIDNTNDTNDSDDEKKTTRLLTYERSKLADKYNAKGLTEKGFNLYYCNESGITTVEQYTNNYKIAKFGIEDSILDDNNNIVNYSLPNEISVVRLKLTYTYGR